MIRRVTGLSYSVTPYITVFALTRLDSCTQMALPFIFLTFIS